MTFENFNFAININYAILTILIFIAGGYSYYSYKHTIPKTSNFVKFILIFLRSSALALIIIVLFEPVITLNYLKTNRPINLLFVDNSSSIVNKDSTNRSRKIHKFISNYKNTFTDNIKVVSFGKNVAETDLSDAAIFKFDESVTNFEDLIPFIKNQKEKIATITLVSDGIITEGSNSILEFEKLNIPFFTVAVGDTTKPSDIAVNKVEFNKLIYLNNKTEINAVISNLNFSNRTVFVSLSDNSGIIKQKKIKLNKSGINNISFIYEPTKLGKQNLQISVSHLAKEETHINNKYQFVVNVLNDKTNILVIAGAPSADLSTIIKSLSNNDKINLNKIVQINSTTFLDGISYRNKIDSAEIILMIDFPTTKTPSKLFNSITNKLIETPYFLFLSELTDFKKLMSFNKLLPFNTRGNLIGNFSSQVEVISEGSGIFNDLTIWNSFPPIKTNGIAIEKKSNASLLAVGKTRNSNVEQPILLTSQIASTRSIVFNGYNFWKWKVQADVNLENIFEQFLNNSVRWLATKKEERIFVKPTKDIFTINETINFIGNVYDETLTPVNNASIEIKVYSENFKNVIMLQPKNNGIYEGNINISAPGSYKYTATIKAKKEKPQTVKGNFFISDIKLEKINFVLNSNYLTFISNNTSGKSFDIDNHSNLFFNLKQLSKIKTKAEIISAKYDVWENDLVLIIIIMLFAIEWIIRKQKGML